MGVKFDLEECNMREQASCGINFHCEGEWERDVAFMFGVSGAAPGIWAKPMNCEALADETPVKFGCCFWLGSFHI